MPKPKPRILCLHGGCSNNDITPFQTLGLQLSERAECVYLHAPHTVARCYPGLDLFSAGPWYAWADPSRSLAEQEDQWDASLAYLARFVAAHGPFAGAYGFSQGAAVVTHFSHPAVWRERFRLERPPWKCAVLACGGASHYVTLPRSEDDTIDMPSFHIFGQKDRLLVDGRKIAAHWHPSRATTHTHGRGHEIDARMHARETELMTKLHAFLDAQLSPASTFLGGFASTLAVPECQLFGHTFGGARSR